VKTVPVDKPAKSLINKKCNIWIFIMQGENSVAIESHFVLNIDE
jgi:hypothetical protein